MSDYNSMPVINDKVKPRLYSSGLYRHEDLNKKRGKWR
jgi:hypothetical protein